MARIELWQRMAEPIAPGDTFLIAAGCDKQFSTCKAKFDNLANFRGFPYVPGNDFMLSAASRQGKNDRQAGSGEGGGRQERQAPRLLTLGGVLRVRAIC